MFLQPFTIAWFWQSKHLNIICVNFDEMSFDLKIDCLHNSRHNIFSITLTISNHLEEGIVKPPKD